MTGAAPVDLTSALFLARRHPSGSLPPWDALTTGAPAVLGEPDDARRLAARVAAGQGAAAGLVARSSLHALIDVVGSLTRPGDVLALDEASYPVTRWAAAVAATRGVQVILYPHHRPERLPRHRRGPTSARPAGRLWIATDGWCPGCNRPAPLHRIAALARDGGGAAVVDDTLAFGILGRRPAGPRDDGFEDGGFGDGTGTVRWWGLDHDETVVWIASLAKAHGAPLAVVTGDAVTLARVRRDGGSRVHSSPPTAADVAAANRSVRDVRGNAARRRLLESRVRRLREQLDAAGIAAVGLPFPLVAVPSPQAGLADRLRRLERSGVRALALTSRCSGRTVLAVLVRADVGRDQVDRAADAIVRTTHRRLAS